MNIFHIKISSFNIYHFFYLLMCTWCWHSGQRWSVVNCHLGEKQHERKSQKQQTPGRATPHKSTSLIPLLKLIASHNHLHPWDKLWLGWNLLLLLTWCIILPWKVLLRKSRLAKIIHTRSSYTNCMQHYRILLIFKSGKYEFIAKIKLCFGRFVLSFRLTEITYLYAYYLLLIWGRIKK